MCKSVVNKLNSFQNYKFDDKKKKVINLKNINNVDLDEFLEITYILDTNLVNYEMTREFEINIIK